MGGGRLKSDPKTVISASLWAAGEAGESPLSDFQVLLFFIPNTKSHPHCGHCRPCPGSHHRVFLLNPASGVTPPSGQTGRYLQNNNQGPSFREPTAGRTGPHSPTTLSLITSTAKTKPAGRADGDLGPPGPSPRPPCRRPRWGRLESKHRGWSGSSAQAVQPRGRGAGSGARPPRPRPPPRPQGPPRDLKALRGSREGMPPPPPPRASPPTPPQGGGAQQRVAHPEDPCLPGPPLLWPPETNAKLVEITAGGRAGPRATRGARAPVTREAVSEGRGRTPRGQRSWARASWAPNCPGAEPGGAAGPHAGPRARRRPPSCPGTALTFLPVSREKSASGQRALLPRAAPKLSRAGVGVRLLWAQRATHIW